MHKFYFKAFVAAVAGTVLIMLLGIGSGYLLRGSQHTEETQTTSVTTTTEAPQGVQSVPSSQEPDPVDTQTSNITTNTIGANSTTKTTDQIQIPGFDKLIFKSGTRSQEVTLSNPDGNTCFFVITLSLPDGSEFYRSAMIKPGEKIERIDLTKDIAAGTYDGCVMRYDCYDLTSFDSLNGATNNFTLEVK